MATVRPVELLIARCLAVSGTSPRRASVSRTTESTNNSMDMAGSCSAAARRGVQGFISFGGLGGRAPRGTDPWSIRCEPENPGGGVRGIRYSTDTGQPEKLRFRFKLDAADGQWRCCQRKIIGWAASLHERAAPN